MFSSVGIIFRAFLMLWQTFKVISSLLIASNFPQTGKMVAHSQHKRGRMIACVVAAGAEKNLSCGLSDCFRQFSDSETGKQR